MSYDLYINRAEKLITVEEFAKVLSEIESSAPEFKFEKLSDKAYEAFFLDAEIGSVDLQDQTIVLSTNSHLLAFIAYITLKIAESFNAKIFDPQHQKNVKIPISKVTIEALKARREKLFESKEEKIIWASNHKPIDFTILRTTVKDILLKSLPGMDIRISEDKVGNFFAMIFQDKKVILRISCVRKSGSKEFTEQQVHIALSDISLESQLQKLADILSEKLGVTFTKK